MGSIPFIENYSNFMEYNFNMKTYLNIIAHDSLMNIHSSHATFPPIKPMLH